MCLWPRLTMSQKEYIPRRRRSGTYNKCAELRGISRASIDGSALGNMYSENIRSSQLHLVMIKRPSLKSCPFEQSRKQNRARDNERCRDGVCMSHARLVRCVSWDHQLWWCLLLQNVAVEARDPRLSCMTNIVRSLVHHAPSVGHTLARRALSSDRQHKNNVHDRYITLSAEVFEGRTNAEVRHATAVLPC